MKDDLQATLDELDGFIRSEHPELHLRFRPGLSGAEIERLADEVRPYHLPVDFVVVHRWHDGWDLLRDNRRVDLLPDADFSSLEESVRAYRSWLDTLGSDGWHPLWFPAFGTQTGELVILQLEPGQAAGQLYSFHPEEDLRTSYDSVAALFASALDCWRSGLFPPRDIYHLTPELRQLVARHNPASRLPDGQPRRTISRFSTRDWPVGWRDVLGITEITPVPDEEVVTVAHFLSDPAPGRPVRVQLRIRGGRVDAVVATATDPTGEVTVLLSQVETENFRELAGGKRYELWLAPARAGADVPYVAKRVVPLE